MEKNKKTTHGTAGLVCGILSLVLCFMPYFGLPLSIMAMIFANIQRKNNKNSTATTALVLGIIGTVINAIMLIFVVFLLALMPELLKL